MFTGYWCVCGGSVGSDSVGKGQQDQPPASRVWVPLLHQATHAARPVSSRWWVVYQPTHSSPISLSDPEYEHAVTPSPLLSSPSQVTLCTPTRSSLTSTCPSSCTISTTGSSTSAPSRSFAGDPTALRVTPQLRFAGDHTALRVTPHRVPDKQVSKGVVTTLPWGAAMIQDYSQTDRPCHPDGLKGLELSIQALFYTRNILSTQSHKMRQEAINDNVDLKKC